jgi:hypothetical protein
MGAFCAAAFAVAATAVFFLKNLNKMENQPAQSGRAYHHYGDCLKIHKISLLISGGAALINLLLIKLTAG